MKSVLARHTDGTIQLTITIAQDEVKKMLDQVVDQTASQAKVAGFRKGKAPKKIVEGTVDKVTVREEALKKLLPKGYIEAVTEHKLRPIMNPKIHVEKLEDDKDWVFTATTCEMPEINLGKYKEAVGKITAKSKIIVPGKDLSAGRQEPEKPNFDEIIRAVLDTTSVTIPKILIDQEVERLLSQTLDEIKRIGLTLDQYLSSTGKTPEQLRDDYAQKAENDIKLEFVLQKIAEVEKITVNETEVQEAILKAKDPKERENLERNRYVLTSILRQQKTLDFLRTL